MSTSITQFSEAAPPWRWTAARERAAALVAADDQNDEAIAAGLGINRRTLARWKLHPTFAARVGEHVAEVHRRIRLQGIAVIENRIAAQNHRWLMMRRLIRERAADPAMKDVPGGGTGLLVRDVKNVDGKEVSVFYFDASLLRELRELEKHSATELGQWTEKHETVSKVPVRIIFDVEPDGGAGAAGCNAGALTPPETPSGVATSLPVAGAGGGGPSIAELVDA